MRAVAVLVRLTGQLVARLVKAVLLVALLAGIPFGLATQLGSPLPRTLPSVDSLREALTGPVSDALVLDVLAVAAWILWAAFTVSIVVEVGAAVRGVPAPRLRLLGPTQALAGWLLAGMLAAAPVAAAVTPGTSAVATAPAGPNGAPAATAVHEAPARPAVVHAATATHARPAAAAHTARDRPVYEVARGDWMVAVAQRFLGDENRYPEIAALNPRYERQDHRFPDHWEATWRIALPEDARDRGPRPHATGHLINTVAPNPTTPPAGPGNQPAPGPATPAPPGSGPPASPTPTAPASPTPTGSPSGPARDPDGVVGEPGPGPATASGSPRPPSPTPTATGPPSSAPTAPHRDGETGVNLPGGWISIGLATAVALAGSLVWLRRRRRYIPGPLAGPELDDPDLQPLPPVVEAARQAVRRHAPDLLHPPRDTLTVREAAELRRAGKPIPPPPPPGPDGTRLAGLTEPLPPGGLGLTGPGTDDAARALLVATLSAGGPDDPDAAGRAVIPAATFATLLGAAAVDIGVIPRLSVTADLPAALTHLEELIIERRRELEEQDALDADDLQKHHPYAPSMPLVLLLAEPPDPALRARLTTALHLGRPLHISAVLLGEWPRGDTLTVGADGHTNGGTGQRLSTLDADTAAQLLHVLREAHTGERVSHAPADPAAPGPDGARAAPDQLDPDPPADPAHTEEPDPAGQGPPPRPGSPDAAAPAAGQPGAPDGTGADAGGATPTEPDEAGAEVVPDRVAVEQTPVRAHARVLGRPALLRLDGTPVDELRSNALALLVFLAVHRAGASLDDIKLALYPDAQLTRADERLATDVANLRNRIRHILGVTGKNAPQPVVNTGGHYHLNPDLVEVDWWTVQDAIAEATATKAPAARDQALRRAVDAYHGPLAEGAEYEWSPEAREQVRRHGVLIHTHLAALVADRDPAEAARLLEAACDLDPFNEELTCQAMRAHAHVGDAEALRQRLRRLRTALGDLDEEPDEATDTLAAALLAQIPSQRSRGRPPAEGEDD